MAQSMFNLKKQNEQRPHTNNLFVWGAAGLFWLLTAVQEVMVMS